MVAPSTLLTNKPTLYKRPRAPCPKCGILFATKSSADRHYLRKHKKEEELEEERRRRWIPLFPECPECNHQFSTERGVRRHFKRMHAPKEEKKEEEKKEEGSKLGEGWEIVSTAVVMRHKPSSMLAVFVSLT